MKYCLIILCVLCLTACVSRLSRPEITGYILDEQGQPLAQVQVGERLTDERGHFCLTEKRYDAFFLTELLTMEAPAVYVQEQVSKAGFQNCTLMYYNPHGGGQRVGSQWLVGEIILQSADNSDLSHQIDDCRLKNEEK